MSIYFADWHFLDQLLNDYSVRTLDPEQAADTTRATGVSPFLAREESGRGQSKRRRKSNRQATAEGHVR
eukprot:4462947-Pleurochrysis_carterae.AAC.2